MKTERFTRENLLVLRKQMNDALTEITKTTGVVFSIGNIRFDEVSFKVTLSARTTDEGGAVKASTDEKARADFAAASNGIKYGRGYRFLVCLGTRRAVYGSRLQFPEKKVSVPYRPTGNRDKELYNRLSAKFHTPG